jgi:hypothetical protein
VGTDDACVDWLSMLSNVEPVDRRRGRGLGGPELLKVSVSLWPRIAKETYISDF